MDLLLIHLVLLVWLSVGAAARWTDHPADRFLAAGALGWANLVATALLVSPFHRLGQPPVFLAVSLGLALTTSLVAVFRPAPAAAPAPESPAAHPGLQLAALVTLVPLALASAAVAVSYLPSSPDMLAHELPRALLQVGEGSIFALQAPGAAQTAIPLCNYGLLQTGALVYQAPLTTLNLFNLFGWGLAGLAVHRFCRNAGWSSNGALFAAWCALTTTPVLAHAVTTDHRLSAAAALLAALAFALDWAKRNRSASAAFAGLLAGLAGGSTPGVLCVVLGTSLSALLAGRLPRPGRKVALLGLAFGLLPFAINLVMSVGTHLPHLLTVLQLTPRNATSLSSSLLWPLWKVADVLLAPTEDSVGLGLTGLACLVAAGLSLTWLGARNRLAAVLAALALGWLAILWGAGCWLPISPGALLLVVLLAAPTLAAVVDRLRPPGLTLALGIAIAAGGMWSAQLYVWRNANRPFAALFDPSLAPSKALQLPALLNHRVGQEQRINFSTDGDDPLLFALMGRQHQLRFGTQNQFTLDGYNVISRSSRDRQRTVRQLADGPAYLLIAFPDKPTAGVEFLGSIVVGNLSRDYLGISGAADRILPITANRTVLLTITRISQAGDQAVLRANLVGLNPHDHARLEIWSEPGDGPRTLLATLTAHGTQDFRSPAELRRLHMRIVSTADGRELGTAELTDQAVAAEEVEKPDPRRLFNVDFVTPTPAGLIECSPGLTPPEGPFPQWGLPLIRWARENTIRLQVPPTHGLARLRLSFNACLHLRERAIMEIAANGQVLRRLAFNDPRTWQSFSVDFPALPGNNVIELRDALLPPEPDWAGYLKRYPDVKRYVELQHQSPREGALEHYKYSGQPEGRTMDFIPPPRPAPDAFFFMFRRLRVEGLHP